MMALARQRSAPCATIRFAADLHVAYREAIAVAAPEASRCRRRAGADRRTDKTFSADMKASMALDLDRGNRLELPWLSGKVAELGRQLGVPTPTHG